MFSSVQNRVESTLSYFGYGSQPSLPTEIPKSLENQELSAECTSQDHRIASTPPSIWKRVASLGMSYLVFSSGQSSVQSRGWIPAVSFTTLSEPLTFIAGLSLFPDRVDAQSLQTTFFEVFGGANDDIVEAITTTPEGDLVVESWTSSFGAGSADVLLTKFSSNGTLLWANTLGGESNDIGRSITTTPEGDLVVAGYTRSFGAGSDDVLLSKFSSNGTLLWANTLGGASDDRGHALTITSEGDLVVAGWTSSFGAGSSDVLLAKWNAQGVIENCSAWQSVTPEVQSITPSITDVTLNMATDVPPWTAQDARSALNVSDITSLLNQTTVCYAQTTDNRTFTTSLQTSHSSETPLPSSQNILSSSSMIRTSSVRTTDRFSVSSMSLQNTDVVTSTSTPSPSRESTIPSITVLVYEESYPIIVNGETIGTFYFTGGEGQLYSGNVNTLNIQLDGDVIDGETITLFTIPQGEEPLWEDIVLSDGTECVTTEGVFTTSEEEHSYQLIFQHESSECSQYTAALKLSAIPVLGSGLL